MMIKGVSYVIVVLLDRFQNNMSTSLSLSGTQPKKNVFVGIKHQINKDVFFVCGVCKKVLCGIEQRSIIVR